MEPGVDCPNLATHVLALNLARLSADWERAYGHPILAVESFVDRQVFRGNCYRAQGWKDFHDPMDVTIIARPGTWSKPLASCKNPP